MMLFGKNNGYLLMLALIAECVHAQSYPSKPVRLVVPFPAGGSTDIVARFVGQKLGESLGQQFVVENRAGAAGNIGTDHVAKATPDGYTLLVCGSAPLAANVSLYAKLPFDPLRDFAPIIQVANQPNVLVLHPSVPARTVKDFIALVKLRPGKLNYASSGVGGSQHMAAVLFVIMTGVDIVHVPYKGGAPALNDLVGGQVDFMFETIPTGAPYIKAGKLRALAVTSVQRLITMPDIPTMEEGGVAGFDYKGFIGFVAPAATPKEIITRLNAEIQGSLSGDLRKRLSELSLDVVGGTPEQFSAFMREEIAKYAKLVKAAGIAPQ